jgi:hypothetical protein
MTELAIILISEFGDLIQLVSLNLGMGNFGILIFGSGQ